MVTVPVIAQSPSLHIVDGNLINESCHFFLCHCTVVLELVQVTNSGLRWLLLGQGTRIRAVFVGSVCEREVIGLGTCTSKAPPIAPAQALAKRQGQERHIFLEHMSAVSAAVSLGTVNIEFSFNVFYLGGVNIRNAFHHIWAPRWFATRRPHIHVEGFWQWAKGEVVILTSHLPLELCMCPSYMELL